MHSRESERAFWDKTIRDRIAFHDNARAHGTDMETRVAHKVVAILLNEAATVRSLYDAEDQRQRAEDNARYDEELKRARGT